jgi:hypothetical protein
VATHDTEVSERLGTYQGTRLDVVAEDSDHGLPTVEPVGGFVELSRVWIVELEELRGVVDVQVFVESLPPFHLLSVLYQEVAFLFDLGDDLRHGVWVARADDVLRADV